MSKQLLEKHLGKNNPMLSSVTSFSQVVRNVGDLDEATTLDGLPVRRVDKIDCSGYGLVPVAQYSAHFVYEDPSRKLGRWVHMCTCGSPAVIVSYNSPIKTLMSKPSDSDFVLVCLQHTTTRGNDGRGKHSDGVEE